MKSLLQSTLNTRALPTGDLRYIRSDFSGNLSDEEVQWLVDNNITTVTFVRKCGNNFWWRWIYICGGSYLLFDLFAIVTRLKFWQELLGKMFDIQASYWNYVWGFFVLLGGFVFVLGINLMIKRKSS